MRLPTRRRPVPAAPTSTPGTPAPARAFGGDPLGGSTDAVPPPLIAALFTLFILAFILASAAINLREVSESVKANVALTLADRTPAVRRWRW